MPETIRTSWLARNVLIVEGVKQDLRIVTNNVRIASIGRQIGLIPYLKCINVRLLTIQFEVADCSHEKFKNVGFNQFEVLIV